MKYSFMKILFFLLCLSLIPTISKAEVDPEKDKEVLWNYFSERFKDIAVTDYVNGNYVFSKDLYEQWQEAEADFPPYEDAIEAGRKEWNTPLRNGKSYAGCFAGMDVSQIRSSYPFFDQVRNQVITIELALNECRLANSTKPFKWQKGPLAKLSAYLAYEARGNEINPVAQSPEAKAAYERGKHLFYGKRGQLNMACADCHVYYAGHKARAQVLSSVIGQISHFPVHRKKWGNLGTLHRRYVGCQKNIRAKPFKPQSVEYRNIEFFQTFMSKGLKWNGPQSRG